MSRGFKILAAILVTILWILFWHFLLPYRYQTLLIQCSFLPFITEKRDFLSYFTGHAPNPGCLDTTEFLFQWVFLIFLPLLGSYITLSRIEKKLSPRTVDILPKLIISGCVTVMWFLLWKWIVRSSVPFGTVVCGMACPAEWIFPYPLTDLSILDLLLRKEIHSLCCNNEAFLFNLFFMIPLPFVATYILLTVLDRMKALQSFTADRSDYLGR